MLVHAQRAGYMDNTIIRAMPIRQRIDWLMDYAHHHSTEFQSSESVAGTQPLYRTAPNRYCGVKLHGRTYQHLCGH